MFIGKTRIVLVGIRESCKNDWKKAEYGSHVEEIDESCGRRRSNIMSLTVYIWDALNVNVKRTRILLANLEKCSNHEFLLQQLNRYQDGRGFTQKRSHGLTTWKHMPKSALRYVVN